MSKKRGAGSRGAMTIESRIAGRLAASMLTGTVDATAASVRLRGELGQRLATLVESGDWRAIRLAATMRKRAAIMESGGALPTRAVKAIEADIAGIGRELGIDVDLSALELTEMMGVAASGGGFSSHNNFRSNLTEGLLLNVNRLASNALSIPHGQYVVWTTGSKNTVLVPTSEAREEARDLAKRPGQYDVMTRDLLGCWNKVERVLGEASSSAGSSHTYENPATGTERVGRPALKRKVDAAGGVRAASRATGLSPGDVSKHVNNQEFEISGDSARAYMDGVGADPNDLYKYGQITLFDYGGDDDGNERNEEDDGRTPE